MDGKDLYATFHPKASSLRSIECAKSSGGRQDRSRVRLEKRLDRQLS